MPPLNEKVIYMRERKYALLGIIGPVIAYFFIIVSIALSPWFNWQNNALSDLGHAARSVAPLYNFGLLLGGLFIVIYSVTIFHYYAKYAGYCLLFSALLLQLVAAFDEVYGFLHFSVSVLLFVSFGLTSLVYFVERRSAVALAAFIVSLVSWILWVGVYFEATGVAVPEAISSLATASWVVSSAIRIYVGK